MSSSKAPASMGPIIIGLSQNDAEGQLFDAHTFERPVLDLNYRTFDNLVEGIRVIGSWVFNENPEPCLVLLHPRRSLDKCQPCIVRLSQSWKWQDFDDATFRTAAEQSVAADGAREVAHICRDFAPHLGINESNPRSIFRIVTAVRKRMYDLVSMPPPPLRPLTEFGTVTLTNRETGKTSEAVLKDEL